MKSASYPRVLEDYERKEWSWSCLVVGLSNNDAKNTRQTTKERRIAGLRQGQTWSSLNSNAGIWNNHCTQGTPEEIFKTIYAKQGVTVSKMTGFTLMSGKRCANICAATCSKWVTTCWAWKGKCLTQVWEERQASAGRCDQIRCRKLKYGKLFLHELHLWYAGVRGLGNKKKRWTQKVQLRTTTNKRTQMFIQTGYLVSWEVWSPISSRLGSSHLKAISIFLTRATGASEATAVLSPHRGKENLVKYEAATSCLLS